MASDDHADGHDHNPRNPNVVASDENDGQGHGHDGADDPAADDEGSSSEAAEVAGADADADAEPEEESGRARESSGNEDEDGEVEDGDEAETGQDLAMSSSADADAEEADADDNFRRRKVLFGDCALVEIIHLHDCLRGALRALHRDVTELARTAASASSSSSSSSSGTDGRRGAEAAGAAVGGGRVDACDELAELERRVAARFKVIWSVFRAHSAAEDEFIWPALRSKITLPPSRHNQHGDHTHERRRPEPEPEPEPGREEQQPPPPAAAAAVQEQQNQANDGGNRQHQQQQQHNLIEPEEYEEDHADEERMFLEMDNLLSKLRDGLQSPHTVGSNGGVGNGGGGTGVGNGNDIRRGAGNDRVEADRTAKVPVAGSTTDSSSSGPGSCCCNTAVRAMTTEIQAMSKTLSRHLLQHLEKEEVQCMPLVLEHLTKSEITDLVGKIMGKRSSDLMSQILTMAVQTLPEAEREDMVGYMRQAMVGTFFERWLAMEGFWTLTSNSNSNKSKRAAATAAATTSSSKSSDRPAPPAEADRKMRPAEAKGEAAAEVAGGEDADRARDDVSAGDCTERVAAAASGGSEKDADAFSSALPIVADACRGTYDRIVRGADTSTGKGPEPRRGRCQVAEQPSPQAFACAAAEAGSSTTTTTSPSEGPSVATVPCCTICKEAGRCLLRDVRAAAGDGGGGTVSREELERLIRSIGSNPGLTSVQKSTTIQGLRDSVWESNRRRSNSVGGGGGGGDGGGSGAGTKRKYDGSSDGDGDGDGDGAAATARRCCISSEAAINPMTTHQAVPPSTCAGRRGTAPSSYYKKDDSSGEVRLVWSSESPSMKIPTDQSIPLFSASELAPTYHDGATAAVLGCPHYARSCKLRHPSSGRLYTCRLCCEQEREMPLKVQDSPLDRYSVSEVLCMHCGALQPANDHCVNPKCDTRGRPFAKYTCKICNLYDDGSHKRIYHCPFCNVCRAGTGLGIDFRHCMRCNACVSLGADGEHVCIPQRLQGNCPICHETMFESTEPLKGLKCGHVMHLKCFTLYRRAVYTCPLCKKSVEDMREYFSMLDAAVRMQPMPAVYSHISSKIYCQDCCKTGKVQYHFVGCKCRHCGSYNTREIERCAEAS